jgi:hypothetical protein
MHVTPPWRNRKRQREARRVGLIVVVKDGRGGYSLSWGRASWLDPITGNGWSTSGYRTPVTAWRALRRQLAEADKLAAQEREVRRAQRVLGDRLTVGP